MTNAKNYLPRKRCERTISAILLRRRSLSSNLHPRYGVGEGRGEERRLLLLLLRLVLSSTDELSFISRCGWGEVTLLHLPVHARHVLTNDLIDRVLDSESIVGIRQLV